MSEYEPKDLFSRDQYAKRRALEALFICPQNNLAVYKNGVKVYPGKCMIENLHDVVGHSQEDIVAATLQVLEGNQDILDLILSLQVKQ